jgi:hypothetical protein
MNYKNSYIRDPNSNVLYLTTSGSNLRPISAYGSVCSDTQYSQLAAWTNSPTYGYSEPSFTTKGFCARNWYEAIQGGGGIIHNPVSMIGGPDNSLAQMRAPNSGDSAYVKLDWGTKRNGTLSLYGFSYNATAPAYISYVTVYTSSDDATWSSGIGQTWNPSPTNTPIWHSFGTVTNVRYAKVLVTYVSFSANVYIDAVEIG